MTNDRLDKDLALRDDIRLLCRTAVASCAILFAGALSACQTDAAQRITESCLTTVGQHSKKFIEGASFPEPEVATGGMVRTDSGIVAYDRQQGVIVSYARDGQVRWTAGRQGNGPYELADARTYERLWFGSARWIHSHGNRQAVFDGRSILVLQAGRFVAQLPVPVKLVSGLSRVHLVHWMDTANVVLVIQRDPVFANADSGRYQIDFVAFPVDGSAYRTLGALPTLAWPTTKEGIPVHGLGEASATVAARGDCAVVSDGSSNTLRVFDLTRGTITDRRIGLPEQYVAEADAEQYEKLGVPRGQSLPVKFRSRVGRLSLDESGQIWILPSRRVYAGEVWRLPIGANRVVIDTLDGAEEQMRFADH